jgi:hypothetical protein
LLRLLEDWREALDKNYYIASVLMELSKAFDCLPHAILLDKLSAYGVSAPVSIDKFINDVNWLDIIGLHCLSCLITLAGMLSNPEAFFIFI